MRVLFAVTIDLHWIITSGCVFRNALTSLLLTMPVDETVELHKIKICRT